MQGSARGGRYVEDGGGEEELCSSPPWLSLGMDAALARTAALYPGRLAPSPGHLFAWGKAGGKGGNALPVAASAVDKAGDCIYPAPCKVPKGTGAVFLKASVDVGPFCALCLGHMDWQIMRLLSRHFQFRLVAVMVASVCPVMVAAASADATAVLPADATRVRPVAPVTPKDPGPDNLLFVISTPPEDPPVSTTLLFA